MPRVMQVSIKCQMMVVMGRSRHEQVEIAFHKQMQTCKFCFCSGHKRKKYFPNDGSINQCECIKVYLYILLLYVTVSRDGCWQCTGKYEHVLIIFLPKKIRKAVLKRKYFFLQILS